MRRRGYPPMHGGRRGPTTTGSRRGYPPTPGGRGGKLRPMDGNNGTNGNQVQNGNQVKSGLFMKRRERRKKAKLKEERKVHKKHGSMLMNNIKVHKQSVTKTTLQPLPKRKPGEENAGFVLENEIELWKKNNEILKNFLKGATKRPRRWIQWRL